MSINDFQIKGEFVARSIFRVQKFLFYFSLPVIFLFIIPVPWSVSTFGRGLSVIFFGSLILFLEIIKFLYIGKFSIIKSNLDKIIGLLFISILLSTVFSASPLVSFFGFNMDLGSGLLFFVLSMVYVYIARIVLLEEHENVFFLKYLICIMVFTLLLGWLPLIGLQNLTNFGALKYITELRPTLLLSYSEYMLVASITVVLTIGYFADINVRRNKANTFVFLLGTVIPTISVFLYSGHSPKFLILLLFVVSLYLGLLTLLHSLQDNYLKGSFITIIAVVLIMLVVNSISPVIKYTRFGDNAISNELVLPLNDSWKNTVLTLASNLKSGIFGIGYDLNSVSVSKYLLDYSAKVDDSDRYYYYSDLFRVSVEQGLFGLIVLLFVTQLFFRQVIQDLLKIKHKLTGIQYTQYGISVALFAILIYQFTVAGSSSFVLFIFGLLLSLFILYKNNYSSRESELFVVEVDFLLERISQQKSMFAPRIILYIVFLLICLSFVFSGLELTSFIYAFKAEYKIHQMMQSNSSDDIKKNELKSVLDTYFDSLRFVKWNYVVNRRVSVLYLQYIKYLELDYKTVASDIDRENIYKEIQRNAGYASDFALRSTDIAPVISRNWISRINTYYQLISLGLTNYLPQALETIQSAKNVSPYNYVIWFYDAQFLALNGQGVEAKKAVETSLIYSPNYVPSLVFAGDLEYANSDWANAKVHYTSALQLLEDYKDGNLDMYTAIKNRLEEIGEKLTQ